MKCKQYSNRSTFFSCSNPLEKQKTFFLSFVCCLLQDCLLSAVFIARFQLFICTLWSENTGILTRDTSCLFCSVATTRVPFELFLFKQCCRKLHHLQLFYFLFFFFRNVKSLILKVMENPCISIASYKFEISALISLQDKWWGMLGEKEK